MGIRKSLLVIEGLPLCSTPDLVRAFGFWDVTSLESATLGMYIFPDENFLAVAYWNGFTIIAHDTLPLSLIESDFVRRKYENAVGFFKKQNALAVLLDSSDNLYAMRLRKDGKDCGIYGRANSSAFKYGEMTPIEAEYFEKSYYPSGDDPGVRSWGSRTFIVDGQEFTHDQIGEDIVLWNLQEFIQKPPGGLYDLDAEIFSVTDEHLQYHP